MGKKVNIYLIESPFQLLQAYEMIDQNEKNKSVFIVRLNHIDRNNDQLKNLVKVFNLRNVFFFNTRKKLYALFYVIPFLSISLASSKIIVGDESSFFFKIAKYLVKKKKVILLDDGVATLSKKSSTKYKRFTIFDNINGDKNNLQKCQSFIKIEDRKKKKVNIIIGSKLVEENICTRECYYSLLRRIKNNFNINGLDVLYIPHRGESEESIKNIQNQFSFYIVRNTLPIELIGYEKKVNPILIGSIMSTALYSMSLIYKGAKFEVYPISKDDILSRKEAIVDLYSVMKKYNAFNFVENKDSSNAVL